VYMDQQISDYLNTYLDIIFEYLDVMKQSNFISTHINREFLIYTGFRAITHIFQINYMVVADLDTSFYSSQKAYIFYLEYLEQMEKTNMSHDLNYTDAIQFLYSKTIFQVTPVVNVTTSDQYAKVSKLVELCIWTGGMRLNIKKKAIMNCFQVDYESVLYCLEITRLRNIDDPEYEAFLSQMCITLKKHTCRDIDIQKIYKIRDLQDNLNLPIRQWCKWLVTYQ
jgi:hypothetical protein